MLSRLQYPVPEQQAVLVPAAPVLRQYPVPEQQAVLVPAAPVLRQYPSGQWCNVIVASALTPLLLLNGAECGTSK